jgi:hypothetical protein
MHSDAKDVFLKPVSHLRNHPIEMAFYLAVSFLRIPVLAWTVFKNASGNREVIRFGWVLK